MMSVGASLFLALACFPAMAFASAGGGNGEDILAKLRWKHRVIVYRAPTDRLDELKQRIEAREQGLRERHLAFLRVGPAPEIPLHFPVPASERKTLARRFELSGNDAVFALIGKDGTEKARANDHLDLEAWFEVIDAMPMRQSEMREQRDR